MKLGRQLPTEIEHGGADLYINTAFDYVFRYFEITEDPDFDDAEKIHLLFSLFVENSEAVEDLDEKVELLQRILEDVLGFDLSNDKKETEEPGEAAPAKLFDFTKDAGIIYASFLYDYQIDLFAEQGRLHWRQFVALFENLSEDTMMAKVMGYRGMKVPSGKGVDPEHRKHVIKMKRKYRLEPEQLDDQKVQRQLAGLFAFLKSKAG